jgi:hypothetical protein
LEDYMLHGFRLAFLPVRRNPSAFLRAAVSPDQHGSAAIHQAAPAGRARFNSWALAWGLLAAALLLL